MPHSLLLALLVTAQLTPDQQAEQALAAARKLYNDGNLPAARQQFEQFLAKFGGDRRATDARFGLGLCRMNDPSLDYAGAVEPLTQAANDGGHSDRGTVLYHLAVCQRALGLKEAEKPKADARLGDAARRFQEGRDWFAGKGNLEWAGRCRADQAEAELRLGRVKEARATAEAFTKDAALKDNPHRPLGLYVHGLACFLDKDFPAAGRSLNQLAPFAQPGFGTHARYLVGRVLHLSGETAEASVHYEAVAAEFDAARKQAAEQLKDPNRFKANPAERRRVEQLANGPVPEYVAGAVFHAACLGYEAGRFGPALGQFQGFEKQFPTAPLVPDARLRAGFCLVQLKQFDEAVKVLAPLADQTPRLADQALLWLGRARLGVALAADPNQVDDRRNKLAAAGDAFRRSAEKASQAQPQDADARARRGEAIMELGDTLYHGKQFPEAAQAYQQVWNERLLPDRRHDEVLQRLAAAVGAAGDVARSDQLCAEFRVKFAQSTLTPAVLFRQAENAYLKARDRKEDDDERRKRYADAAGRYQELIDRFPEFERASHARYAVGVCKAQLGDLEAAAKALDAIPAPDRNGELSAAGYLLADCLIRLAPAKADDALAENMIREKLTAASGLLENYAASNPKAADAPDALLKLGHCLKRLGSTLADANERNQLLNKAREFYEKLAKEYPQSAAAGHARLEIAKTRALAGDRGGAMNDLRQYLPNAQLQQSPVAPLALLTLATLLREESKPAEAAKLLADARQRYEAGLRQDKERADWAHLLKYHHGVALLESNQPADARKLLDEVVKEAKGPVGAEAGLRAGQAAVTLARQQIEKGVQEKKPADAQKGREAVLQAAERMERWADEFARTVPTGEPRARLRYDAAWAYRSLLDEELAAAREAAKLPADVSRAKLPVVRSEERATAAYRKLIEEFPDLALAVDARFELAELRAARDDHAEVVKLLREAIDKEPTDRNTSPELLERVRLRLGGSLAATGDYKAALTQFEAVAANEKGPHRPAAAYRAGECLLALEDAPKAVERLKPFVDRGEWHNVPGVSDRAVLRLGAAYTAAKQWEPARQAFETVIARYGSSPFAVEARYGLGWALQAQGKYDEAVGRYDEVVKATQAEVAARAQTQIGLCRLAQKRYPEAAAALLAVSAVYDYPEVGYAATLEAARAYQEGGQPEQAARLLQKLLKDAPPNSEWAKAAKERLEKQK